LGMERGLGFVHNMHAHRTYRLSHINIYRAPCITLIYRDIQHTYPTCMHAYITYIYCIHELTYIHVYISLHTYIYCIHTCTHTYSLSRTRTHLQGITKTEEQVIAHHQTRAHGHAIHLLFRDIQQLGNGAGQRVQRKQTHDGVRVRHHLSHLALEY